MEKASEIFDVNSIRKDFPILSLEVYNKPLAYLDNGASAQKPQCVIDAITNAYSSSYANVHRGLHFLSNAATDLYEQARESVRSYLNAASSDEIIFTKNATEAINTVAYGYAMPNLNEGDEIIISVMEHHSNIVPWHFLRERQGVKLVFLPVDDDGILHFESFEKALSPRTKFVALTHMSNVLGTVPPVKKIIDLAHQHNIPVLIDGAQGAVHLNVDVQALDCDFYVITGHKLYGPSGIGALYGKKSILEKMRPFQGGGEMIEEVREDYISYNHPPHRFEAGTPPIVQAIGLGVALDYVQNIGRKAIMEYEHRLTLYAHERLNEIDGLRIIGNAPNKGGIISFEMQGIHAHDISMFADRQGVALRAGTHCAQPLLTRFDVTSTCRASLAMYNTKEEIDQLANALEKARTFFR
ncbi:cysteine desulfurase [Bartonella sp. HY329]|nr:MULTISPECIES: cysteine desulfurase [unclassified Bartonella]UXM96383.1 cysteine desulfurase [Bartonella sp. HY329]UXN10707.1 cysteine desulfurase [Bartonella sp. HY328]